MPASSEGGDSSASCGVSGSSGASRDGSGGGGTHTHDGNEGGAKARFGPLSAEPPAKRPTEKHPKEALQDALNAIQMPPAEYVLAPCAEPGRMTVECRICGDVASTGTGCDFKEASAQSALNVLMQLRAMQAARAGTSAGPQPRPPWV